MGDAAAGELEEGFVDVGSAAPTNAETVDAVEPVEDAFDDPAVGSQPSAVEGAAAAAGRHDAASADLVAADVVVVPPTQSRVDEVDRDLDGFDLPGRACVLAPTPTVWVPFFPSPVLSTRRTVQSSCRCPTTLSRTASAPQEDRNSQMLHAVRGRLPGPLGRSTSSSCAAGPTAARVPAA